MNGPVRTWWGHVIRGILVFGVFVVPSIGDHFNAPVIFIALGALLAYGGLDDRIVSWSFVFLVAMEIVWGMGIGVLSLSYLLTVLLMRMVQGFFTIEPLSYRSGWLTVPLVRTAALGWVITLVMTTVSVLVQSWVYGRGGFGELAGLSMVPIGTFLVLTGIGALVTVGCLYRIDVPFRSRITFGT